MLQFLPEYAPRTEQAHRHRSAGQILGLHMALHGLKLLGTGPAGTYGKRLFIYIETDRSATDAISIVTGRRLGKRALKFRYFGKVPATFCDLREGRPPARPRGCQPARQETLSGNSRVQCEQCGGGVDFKREVLREGHVLRRACAGERYYEPL
jgi:formylmethanofuran dehydrogenase subunit E